MKHHVFRTKFGSFILEMHGYADEMRDFNGSPVRFYNLNKEQLNRLGNEIFFELLDAEMREDEKKNIDRME